MAGIFQQLLPSPLQRAAPDPVPVQPTLSAGAVGNGSASTPVHSTELSPNSNSQARRSQRSQTSRPPSPVSVSEVSRLDSAQIRRRLGDTQVRHQQVRKDLAALGEQQAAKQAELRAALAHVEGLRQEAAQLERTVLYTAELEGRLAISVDQRRAAALLTCVSPSRLDSWLGAARKRQALLLRRPFEEYMRLANRPSVWESIIAKDVPRTLSCIDMPGNRGEAAEERVRQVLRTWVARSEDEGFGCGYVQSMNFVCAVPCIMFGSLGADAPALAFAISSAVLEDGTLPDLYSAWPPLAGLMATQELFAEEVERRLPRLAEALDGSLNGFLGLVLPKWLLTLFAGVLPSSVLCRMWDEIITASSTQLTARTLQDGSLRRSGTGTGIDTPRMGGDRGQASVVTLRWAMALLEEFESMIIAELAPYDPMTTPLEVVAFDLVQKAVAALDPEWIYRDTGPWDTQRIRRRHAELLQKRREEVEGQRLSRAVTVDQSALQALRAEFEKLRGQQNRIRSVEVHATPIDGPRDLGLIFAPGSSVVLAVNRERSLPPLTGWQLRAVDGAALMPGADLTQPWVDWPVCRWEWESGRHGGFEPFGASDTCALEDSWSAGKGKFTTRGLSFNSKERILYTYDFELMVEIAHDSGKRRTIRRCTGTAGTRWLGEQRDGARGKVAPVELWLQAGGQVAVYENQYFQRAKGGGWAHPPRGTAPAWSDSAGAATDRDEIQPPEACSWDGPWCVDRSVGGCAEGWLYAKSFSGRFEEVQNEGDLVRRRRWVRAYAAVVPPAALEEEDSPEDCSEDTISLEGLAPVISRVLPRYPMELLPNLFRLLDARNVGRIGFYELMMVGLTALEGGTVDSHLRLLHNLYDGDADGLMSRDEVARLVETLRTVAHTRRVIGKGGASIQTFSGQQQRPGACSNLTALRESTPRSRHHVPLPTGTNVVVSGEDGENFLVWWVHAAGRGDEQSTVELKSGFVRAADTQPIPTLHDGDDDLDDDILIAHLFAGTDAAAEQAALGPDELAQAAREPIVWRALSECGIPLGPAGQAGDSTPLATASNLSFGFPAAALFSPPLSQGGLPRASLPSPTQRMSPYAPMALQRTGSDATLPRNESACQVTSAGYRPRPHDTERRASTGAFQWPTLSSRRRSNATALSDESITGAGGTSSWGGTPTHTHAQDPQDLQAARRASRAKEDADLGGLGAQQVPHSGRRRGSHDPSQNRPPLPQQQQQQQGGKRRGSR
eukprot:TRINITY_DN1884_c0_g1_i1.p1 TRINITY_DN1884_c0_g1~~TRINITY_DN1884_c0_g1_i1.p1  ORF type:complete len:1264 (+),score=321.33 TRINITY_DN1884_c0_g1_i1:81-3794(+)